MKSFIPGIFSPPPVPQENIAVDDISVGDPEFNRNLLNGKEVLSEKALEKLAVYLREVTQKDRESRRGWIDLVHKVKPYLGFEIEDPEIDKNNTQANNSATRTKTFDTTFSTAVLRLWALIRSELLPSTGPVGFRTNISNAEDFELKGEKIQDFLNTYLTVDDKGFYPDYDRFLLYLLLYGCVFRKIYHDPNSGEPISRFILPEDFLVDNNCSSILDSNRLTHVRHLSKREIILNMQSGIFRKVELNYLNNSATYDNDANDEDGEDDDNVKNIDLSVYDVASRFTFYETHEYLDLNEFTDNGDLNIMDYDLADLPSPYVITRCGVTNKIVSIVPNWRKDDPTRARINCFIHYNLFPGFDIYGLGLAQILGSNAISLTKMQRMAIDAAIFQNFPGGAKVPGLKNQQTTLSPNPGEFVEVDTGGMPIQQAITAFPFNGPSPALLELSQRLIAQTKELAATSEIGVNETNANMPVGTTLALLEVANRMQSAILRTIHTSFSEEIQLLYKTFKEATAVDRQFRREGNVEQISNNDFIDEIEVIPVSDPSVESSTQRIMKAESELKIASQDPNIHDMRAVYENVYKALGIKNIDTILKPDQNSEEVLPLDPISENINVLKGMPVKAAIWQAHAAHKLTHGLFAESNPDIQAPMMAHIKEHEAYEYLIQSQQMLGAELPPLEQLQNPEVQNAIAMSIAGSLEESGAIKEQPPAPIDPNAVMMADIQQKAAETEARERIATQKTEVDIFKAQLDFEKEKAKIESNEEIAKLKSELELLKIEAKEKEMNIRAEIDLLKTEILQQNKQPEEVVYG